MALGFDSPELVKDAVEYRNRLLGFVVVLCFKPRKNSKRFQFGYVMPGGFAGITYGNFAYLWENGFRAQEVERLAKAVFRGKRYRAMKTDVVAVYSRSGFLRRRID